MNSFAQVVSKLYYCSPYAVVNKVRQLFGGSRLSEQAAPGFELQPFYPEDFKETFQNTGKSITGISALRRAAKDDFVMVVDAPRSLILHQLCKATLPITGDVAECGVYRGGTAYLLASCLMDSAKLLHLFDSFEGMPDSSLPSERAVFPPGQFGDTSVELLRKRLEGFSNYKIYPGFFENALSAVKDLTFSFVHIDCDIYNSAKQCTEFFYPRLSPGGVIIYDDYGNENVTGIKLLVDEFYSDKPESPIVLPTRQCAVIKL